MVNTEINALRMIGERMKALRIQKDMDQEELSQHCGLSRGTISNLENGKGASLLNLLKILRSLGELQKVDDFIPQQQVSPMELLKNQAKTKTMVRKKQRNTLKTQPEGEWSWSN